MVQMIGSSIGAYQPPPGFFGMSGGGGGGAGAGSAGANTLDYASTPGLMGAVGSFLGGGGGHGGPGSWNGGDQAANVQAMQHAGPGTVGNIQRGIGYASMANSAARYMGGGSQALGQGLGAAGGFLSMYTGIQQGGVEGYGSAAVGAMRAGSAVAGMAGDTALASSLGTYAGVAGAALSTYSAIKSYKSGATGADALAGAQAGASWGAYFGPVGMVAGAVIGGVVGAVASAFGGGSTSVEALSAQAYTSVFDKATGAQKQQLAMAASPAQNVQYLQGLMNGHISEVGHESDLQGAFGKNNVAGFTTQMTQQVNSAIKSGTIARNATPGQIFSSVVQPWLASKAGGAKSGSDIKGNAVSAAEQASITGLINQWQSGGFTASSKVGVDGQSINIPSYGG